MNTTKPMTACSKNRKSKKSHHPRKNHNKKKKLRLKYPRKTKKSSLQLRKKMLPNEFLKI